MKRLLTCLLLTTCAATAFAAIKPAQCTQLRMTGAPIDCARLRVVQFSYLGFDGAVHHDGEVVVLAAAAPHVQAIFDTLLARRFALAGARPVEHFDGDDARSMAANNTSAFNHRPVTGGGPPSLHAYGLAIDINPVQNPYVRADSTRTVILPPAGERFQKRTPRHAGMAEDVVEIFAAHGFPIWGGKWKRPIDYQHFQTSRAFAQRVAALPEPAAASLFERYAQRYRQCRRKPSSSHAHCASLGEKPLP